MNGQSRPREDGPENPDGSVPSLPALALAGSSLPQELEVVRRLVETGIPVFLAKPNPDYVVGKKGTRDDPNDEYKMPSNWQKLTADQSHLQQWAVAQAVCMLAGFGLDMVDVDTKHGADVSVEHERLVGNGVEILGHVETPSGGAHFYVLSTGRGSSSNPRVGVDYRGGRPDGLSRGIAYLPGTHRPFYGGKGYRWLKRPDLKRIPHLDLAEQREAITGYFNELGINPPTSKPQQEGDVSAEPVSSGDVPEYLRELLAETGPTFTTADGQASTDRSARFHYLVAECERAGLTRGQAVTLITPWCEVLGLYGGRVGEEVARSWSKLEDPSPTPPRGTKSRSSRDQLIDLAERCYTIGRTLDERAYLVPHDGPNVALLAGAAKKSLVARCYEQSGKAPGRAPVDEAWTVIEGKAAALTKVELPVRVADFEQGLVLDLGRADGSVVVITQNGWEVVSRSPVTFRRSKATMELPKPARGGSLEKLWAIINADTEMRPLFTAWLVAALMPSLPHPILALRGEQGAAKTTASKVTSRLLDPCVADTQRPPKNEDDWTIACSARWLVGVDNVSKIPDWWSDSLCRTVTGEGRLARKLFTDDDISVLAHRRVVVLNGITLSGTLRGDLAERMLFLELKRPDKYLTEHEVWGAFYAARPSILGALLDAVALTLAHLPTATAPQKLRMADFARVLVAFDAAHQTDTLQRFEEQVTEAFDEALEADHIAQLVVDYINGYGNFEGTAGALLKTLGLMHDGDGAWFPKTPAQLTNALAKASMSLKHAGLEWGRSPRTAKQRTIWIRRVQPE